MPNPSDVYLSMNDGMVDIYPNILNVTLNNKNSSDCFIHCRNIVTNWGIIVRQKKGVTGS